jgi:hypothetical protein
MPGTLTASSINDGTNVGSTTDMIKGSARAWVSWDNSNAASAVIYASYNVASVTYNAVGVSTVNFVANTFSDGKYAVAGCARHAGAGGSIVAIDLTVAPTKDACKMVNYNTLSGNLNVTYNYAVFFR